MGEFVPDLELELFLKVRKFSRFAIGFAIVISFIFAQLIESSDITWQVVVALIALAVGIPHGALDHLVTLPRSSAAKMAVFILIYVAVAIAAVIALLTWSVIGFIGVVVMSAVHFGIGDAAFISEIDRRSSDQKPFQKYLYAAAAGTLPVVIPLVSEKSNSALEKVNPQLLDWHQGLNNDLMLWTMVLTAIVLLRLVQKRRDGEAIDLVLLYLLAVTAPPLIAFAVYFGCWHAMRHTARLTLILPKAKSAAAKNNPRSSFLPAVIPGLPALFGTVVVALVIAVLDSTNIDASYLWYLLVVVWALTVPHMLVTAKIDRAALN